MLNLRENPFEKAKRVGKPLILDGAMGSLLQQSNAISDSKLWSSSANINCPEKVISLHKEYIDAGVDIITTNTFRTNPYVLISEGIIDINKKITDAVELAKKSIQNKRILLAGSNPPAEDCYQKERTISQNELEWNHKTHIDYLIGAGCDFILNETQSHFDEIKFICQYCSTNIIPFVISLFFKDEPVLLSGEKIEEVIKYVSKFNPLAIGFNCITFRTLEEAVKYLQPGMNWGFYLNCGSGNYTDKEISCSVSPAEYSENAKKYLSLNPSFIGACCGSNPKHIKLLRVLVDG